MIEKLDLKSPDLTNKNIENIAKLFPNCVTEIKDEKGNIRKAIDFDLLRQELSEDLVKGPKERYRLEWPGKKEALILANIPINKTLRPIKEDSVNFDTTQNLYIEGDNLDALKILQESYLNKIKMIYIDPPYNTGKDFIYKDNFAIDKEEELKSSGQMDEYGNRLIKNMESNGRYHSDWLSMMYPRLKLARNLLRDDGVIFISIDDNEVHNLRKICDEIFGEGNFINQISVKVRESAGESGGGEDKKLKKHIEYFLFYVKNRYSFNLTKLYELTSLKFELALRDLKNDDYGYKDILVNTKGRKYFKSIEDGEGNEIKIYIYDSFEKITVNQLSKKENSSLFEIYKKYWDKIYTTYNARTSIRDRVKDVLPQYDGLIEIEYIPKSGKYKGEVATKYFYGKTKRLLAWLKEISELNEKENDIFIKNELGTLWTDISWSSLATEGDIKFENGKKPINFIKRLIKLSNAQSSDIILDFFSGSATTAHAVMQINAEDGGNRKFIMVQIPEPTDGDSEAYKAGYKNICEIGKERIRRAGAKIIEENKDKEGIDNLDIGFRVLRLDSSNMKDVYYNPDEIKQNSIFGMVSNIKDDRTDSDLLFQVLLDSGVELTLPIKEKEIESKKVYFVGENVLAFCFENNLNNDFFSEFAKTTNKIDLLKVVFKDNSFESDDIRINVEQIFKQYSPSTQIKVI